MKDAAFAAILPMNPNKNTETADLQISSLQISSGVDNVADTAAM